MAVDTDNDTELEEDANGAADPENDQDNDQDNDQEDADDPLAGEPELQKALFDLFLRCSAEDRNSRLLEVKNVKQAENYWAGRQYDWWSTSDNSWKPISTATGGVGQAGFDAEEMPRFQFVTNIYQATGLTVIGAIAGAPPRVRFFPSDADEDKDIETAEGRTKLAKLIQRWNPPQKMLQEEAYHAYTGGFVAWWARYVANGEKYGIDSVNLLTQGAQDLESSISCPECDWSAPAAEAEPPVPCPQCGHPLTQDNVNQEESIPVPEDGGESQIARGREVISVCGALNFKRPQHTQEQSQWHYCAHEEEIHYSILRGAFPHKSDEIKPGMNFGADDVYERNARLSLAENSTSPTQTGSSQASLVTFARVWNRPTAFWMINDKAQRDKLLEIFPRGCRVEFAGSTYCKSASESMDDAIVSTHAMPGRGQHRPAIGTSLLSVQDRYNTLSNISMETYEYGIPITYRASDTFDNDADADQRAAPGLEVEVMLTPGQDLRQKIMQVRADSTSPDMQKHMGDLFGPTTQYLSGTFPALTGAAEDAPDTLGQQGMQRDQAMGRMGVFYVNLKQAKADILTIACRDFEAHTDGEVKIPVLGASGDFESESVDVTALEGEAEAYPEGDENFPELWNQQRATLMQIMASPFGPSLAKDPGNAELIVRMTGIADLKVPDRDSWNKQLKEIAELTKQPKIDEGMSDEDNLGSMLGPVAPNVEVDAVNDNSVVEEACCAWWLNSEVGQKLKRSYPLGWQAVSEHRAQHKAAIPPPPKAPDEKPLAETLNIAFKDMPPEAQAQVLDKLGIHVSPEDFMQKLAIDQATKAPKSDPLQPQPGLSQPGGPGPMPPPQVAAPPQHAAF
jgi:hypothetical protein